MPIIHVNLLEGRTTAQKREFAKRVTAAAVEAFGSKPESVRLLIHEMGPYDFWVGGITTAERAAKANGKEPPLSDSPVATEARQR